MWPEQQPPGGEQNPQNQSPPGQNPYQQPGYQQPNPYHQPGYQQTPAPGGFSQPEPPGQPQWGAPTVPITPQQTGTGGSGGSGGGNKTKLTAVIAASAVVIAAGVTGFLVLGGDKDDDKKTDAKPAGSPSKVSQKPSPSEDGGDTDRGTGSGEKPVVAGWKTVVNPKWGTAFDVPPDWELSTPDTIIGFENKQKADGSTIIVMSAPAQYKTKWCTSDDNKDGRSEDTSLAAVGTKGQNGAKDTKFIARNDSAWWVFGGYTQQRKADKKKIKIGKVESFTTKTGIKGSLATSVTEGVETKGKCDSDGKATTFAFKNAKGDYVAWTLYGAKGVKDELPDATVKKILNTVRYAKDSAEDER